MKSIDNAFYLIESKSEALISIIKSELVMLLREHRSITSPMANNLDPNHLVAILSGDIASLSIEDLAKAFEVLELKVTPTFQIVGVDTSFT